MTIVSDNDGGNVAYSATFNGEEDIYYVRVAPPFLQLLNISTRALGPHGRSGPHQPDSSLPVRSRKKVIIRGMGPSLNGVNGTLANPVLELHQGNTTLAVNDDWKIEI